MPTGNTTPVPLLDKIHRRLVRNDLRLAKILDHFGIPDVSEEEVDMALAEEGVSRPVKSPTAAGGQLSTESPVIHRSPHTGHPTRDGEPR